MFAEVLLASALQIGPFWQQWNGHKALCPFWSDEEVVASARSAQVDTTDVLWPVFTAHRDWWRFCWFTHYQAYCDGGWQFEIMPLWFNGSDCRDGAFWGLFPLYGHHPHFLLMYDWSFCAWPLWMRYRTRREGLPFDEEWMTSNVLLFPFLHWRDDGSWGVWPICGRGLQRESDHRYALWPLFTWATYRPDRDTSGEGRSWMAWPLWASVERERESQSMFLPPLFSWAETRSPRLSEHGDSCPGFRLRCPWPIVEWEESERRSRFSLFPLYERTCLKGYAAGKAQSCVMRFGWRLVELYYGGQGELEESRVFPFWTRNKGFFRLWPFWSSERLGTDGEVEYSRCLELFPIRWVDSVDRNWAPYWTLYESVETPACTEHSLLWGIFRWRTFKR